MAARILQIIPAPAGTFARKETSRDHKDKLGRPGTTYRTVFAPVQFLALIEHDDGASRIIVPGVMYGRDAEGWTTTALDGHPIDRDDWWSIVVRCDWDGCRYDPDEPPTAHEHREFIADGPREPAESTS